MSQITVANSACDMFTLVDLIRSSPGMFVRDPTISSLGAFLRGYIYGIGMIHGGPDLKVEEFRRFNAFVAAEFEIFRNTPKDWETLLVEACNGDQVAACNRFYELFDEFRRIVSRTRPN